MKITGLESLRYASRPNIIHVVIETDEGLSGLGETWFGTAAVAADLHERIAPQLLGQEAGNIERLVRRIKPYVGFFGTGAEMRAVSAVDVALWDLAGKRCGQPVSALLGGAVRDTIAVYNTCAGPEYVSQTGAVRPDNFGLPGAKGKGARLEDLDGFMNRADDLAAELLEMGICSMKIWPFDFAEGAGEGADISTAGLNRALEPFEKIRRAHGDRMAIKAELHGLWSVPAAVKIAQALEALEVDWVEDPIAMDHLADLPRVAAATGLRIAGGETLGGLGQMRELISGGGVSVPIVDVTWGGGISFGRKVSALAEAHGLPIAFHDCSGPVTLAASVNLALAMPNVAEQEIARAFYYGWYHELVEPLPLLENGHISLIRKPGLGVDLAGGVRERGDVEIRRSSL